jgi:PAS domain S-box-containing protein
MIENFLISQLDYIYFIFGLSFVALGVAALFTYHLNKIKAWKWLSALGFAYGLYGWLMMLSVSLGDSQLLSGLRLGTASISFVLLLLFWRSGLNLKKRFLSPIILLFLALAALSCIPALRMAGFYFQLLEALLALAVTWSIWKNYETDYRPGADQSRVRRKQAAFLLIFWALIVLVIAGWFLINWLEQRERSYLDGQLLDSTERVAAIIDSGNLQVLSGSTADLSSQNFLQLKNELQSLQHALPQLKSLYLTRLVSGQPILLMDSESFGTKAGLSPGSVYQETPENILEVFRTGASMIEIRPIDETGTRVSVLAPIKDQYTGKTLAVLRADIDARQYLSSLAVSRSLGIIPVFLLCLAAIFITDSQRRYQQLLLKFQQGGKVIKPTSFGSGLVVILILGALTTLVFFEARESNQRFLEDKFLILAGERSVSVSDSFDEAIESLDNVHILLDRLDTVKRPEFSKLIKDLDSNSSTTGSMKWVPRVPDTARSVYEKEAQADGLKDFKISVRNPKGNLVASDKKDEYFPIYYSEPTEKETDFGLDLGSDPIMAPVLRQARDSGQPISSAPDKGKNGETYFTVAVPIYFGGPIPATVAMRQQLLKGFILGKYSARELIERTLASSISLGVYFRLEGDTDKQASAIFYQQDAGGDFDWNTSTSSLRFEYPIEFAGQTIRLASFPGMTFIKANSSGNQLWILEIGLVLSFLLTMYLRLLLSSRFQAEILVSERTRELRAEKNKLQQYLDSAGMVIMISDLNNRVLLVNKKGREIFKAQVADLISQDWIKMFVSEKDREKTSKLLADLAAGKVTATDNLENLIINKAGETKNIVWHFGSFKNEKGEAQGILGTGMDVTELNEAKVTIDQLKDLDKLKDEVLNIATHELKTPLISIVGLSELMEQQKDNLTPDHQNYITIIHNEGLKLTRMIKNMLTVTRNENNKAPLFIERFNLENFILSLEISLNALAKRTESKIAFDIQIKDVEVEGDKEKISQVIYNFVDNAVKYGLPKQTITVSLAKANDKFVRVGVSGPGAGISADKQKKLFLKFSQLEPSLSRSQDGMGLGLYICKQNIDRLGGEIGVESELGQGATFFFTLSCNFKTAANNS